jgi:hypothetical protein
MDLKFPVTFSLLEWGGYKTVVLVGEGAVVPCWRNFDPRWEKAYYYRTTRFTSDLMEGKGVLAGVP